MDTAGYLKSAAVGASALEEYFGYSVAISGDTAIAGAIRLAVAVRPARSTRSFAAERIGAPGAADAGHTLAPQAGDFYGISVAIEGNTVVVGANAEDSSSTGVNTPANEGADNAGAAFIFVRSGTIGRSRPIQAPPTSATPSRAMASAAPWASRVIWW